jgi:CheY-like chemotaxis protein
VLLAEDTPANVIIAQAFLKRLGHETRHAEDGAKALELLASEDFDLVLMDVEMPGMDGLTATRKLRAGEAGARNRRVPVLAMTAHALDTFRQQSMDAGMNGFLPKPVSFNSLAAALEGLKGAAPARPAGDPAEAPSAGRNLADLERALDMLGGHRELLSEVLDVYLADWPQKLATLRQARLRVFPQK